MYFQMFPVEITSIASADGREVSTDFGMQSALMIKTNDIYAIVI